MSAHTCGANGNSSDAELLSANRSVSSSTDSRSREHSFSSSITAAIAAVMELINDCWRLRESVEPETLRYALATAASLLFPFAPHVSADVYERLTAERVWEQPWPQADEALLERDEYELVCQVNGKVRDRVQASADASVQELKDLCRAAPNVIVHLDGKEVVKEIVVPGKLVNLVVH